MSGTDAFVSGTAVEDRAVTWRKAIARVRALLIDPRNVQLLTRPDGHRWLSDRYVAVLVTNDPTQTVQDVSAEGAPIYALAEDGNYWLKTTGLEPNEKMLAPDTDGLLTALEAVDDYKWSSVEKTPWAIADSPAKLQLVFAWTDDGRLPLAMNEGVWAAVEAAWPVAEDDEAWRAMYHDIQYAPTSGRNIFRVMSKGQVVAYIAGGTLPEDATTAAKQLVQWY